MEIIAAMASLALGVVNTLTAIFLILAKWANPPLKTLYGFGLAFIIVATATEATLKLPGVDIEFNKVMAWLGLDDSNVLIARDELENLREAKTELAQIEELTAASVDYVMTTTPAPYEWVFTSDVPIVHFPAGQSSDDEVLAGLLRAAQSIAKSPAAAHRVMVIGAPGAEREAWEQRVAAEYAKHQCSSEDFVEAVGEEKCQTFAKTDAELVFGKLSEPTRGTTVLHDYDRLKRSMNPELQERSKNLVREHQRLLEQLREVPSQE